MPRCSRKGWRTIDTDPALAAELLREAGFIGTDAAPVNVRASFDAGKRLRRVHARFPGGWTAVLHLSRDGSSTLSQSLRVRVVSEPKLPA